MPSKSLVVVSAIVGFVSVLVGYYAPSMLRSAEQVVEADAAVHVERARRLLHQFHAGLDFNDVAVGQVRTMYGELKTAGAKLDVNPDDPATWSDDAKDYYQEQHKNTWESFTPKQWGLTPRNAQPSYGDVDGQIKDGLAKAAAMMKQNGGLLDEAMTHVDKALALGAGDASGRNLVEANQLKGLIYYYKGVAITIDAQARRLAAVDHRATLNDAYATAAGIQPLANLINASYIDARIREIAMKADEAQADLASRQAQRDKLAQSARDLEARYNAAEQRAAQARTAMDVLKQSGAPDLQVFAAQLAPLDRTYREASREAQSILRGSMPRAQIDAGGDFLTGRYVEPNAATPTTEHGLQHYRNELTIAEREVAGAETILANLKKAKEDQEKNKAAISSRQQQLVAQITGPNGLEKQAIRAFGDLTRVESEAAAIEDKALDLFQKSASAAKDAARAADASMSAASSRQQQRSPAKQEQSADRIRKDARWLGGFVAAGEADARLARARVYLDRYLSAGENFRMYSLLYHSYFQGLDCLPEPERTKADEARKLGVDEINAAMGVLSTVHGKVDRHWTITALAGGARSMMVSFGYPEYLAEAIDDFDSALKGRDDKDFAHWISDRVTALRAAKTR